MKKILIIPSWFSTPYNPTKGTYIEEQVFFLQKIGFDVRVLFVEMEVYPTKKTVFPNLENNKIRLFNKPNAAPLYYKKHWKFRFSSQSLTVKLISRKYLKEVRKFINEGWKPDVIHAHSTFNGGIYANIISNHFTIPYYITEHSYLFFCKSKPIDKQAIKAMQEAKKVGFVSRKQAQLFLMQELDLKFDIVYNLVDEAFFDINEKLKKEVENKIFTIGIIAYPLPIKDMETFFKGIQRFSKITNASFKVIVVGKDTFLSNSDNSIIQNIAKAHGVFEQCTFYKKILREEITTFFSQLDVFVSTSVFETYGLAIREALLSGVPVISTYNGGVDELLDQDIGIGIQIKDFEALANGLNKICNKESVFDSKKIREKVIKEGGQKAFKERMTAFFEV